MLLRELIQDISGLRVVGSGNPEILGMAYNSKCVEPGYLFVCLRGTKVDGNDFIPEALSRGASAILTDSASVEADVPILVVADARAILPKLSTRFFGNPSRRLNIIGVTGTKGKTTTTFLIDSILKEAGLTTGMIGTLGVRIGDEAVSIKNTTPESLDIQSFFARMISKGVSAATMEVSSHALVIGRTEGCEFDVGVFTNLTQDHLDFHGTLDEYFAAKLTLFEEYPLRSGKPFTAVVNLDDPRGSEVLSATKGKTLTYGIKSDADINASIISASANGLIFDVKSPNGAFRVEMSLGGVFNVYNSLAAIGAALALGIDIEAITRGLKKVTSVAGRFVQVNCGQDFGVVIDFAHTPDSLENILRASRELCTGRLILVFGCGGDRDRGKRPIMGRIGAEMADVCLITSDNPRSEEPDAIIAEILGGANGKSAEVECIVDRREAIVRALGIAAPGDLVLIAGKGHENYQIFKDRTVHFDDEEVVREVLGCIANQ